MAQLVVRKLEDRVKAGLLRRAKRNKRSMEEEVRTILRKAVMSDDEAPVGPLGSRLRARFASIGLDRPIQPMRGGRPRPANFGK
jgi:plasmid stability protein